MCAREHISVQCPTDFVTTTKPPTMSKTSYKVFLDDMSKAVTKEEREFFLMVTGQPLVKATKVTYKKRK
jgi:hypothetical protein